MHLVIKNVRLAALAVAVVAVVLAAGSLAPRQTHAANPTTDPSGVLCGALDPITLNPTVGDPIDVGIGTVLARIDWNDPVVTLTAVAYTDPGGTLAMPDCKTLQEKMPGGAIQPDVVAEVRPSVGSLTFAGNALGGYGCQEDFVFGGIPMAGWSRIELDLPLDKDPTNVQSVGTFTLINAYADEAACDAGGPPDPGIGTIVATISTLYLDGPDAVKSSYTSDWDKDGCLDWDELNPAGPNRDPFQPDCTSNAVGGIAELPQVTGGTPLEAAGSSGSNNALIAGVVAAATAVVLAMGGTAWYARRRWL